MMKGTACTAENVGTTPYSSLEHNLQGDGIFLHMHHPDLCLSQDA